MNPKEVRFTPQKRTFVSPTNIVCYSITLSARASILGGINAANCIRGLHLDHTSRNLGLMFYLNERVSLRLAPNACNSFAVYQRRAMNNEQRVSQIMIQEYTQRIYSAAIVGLWVVVVSASFAMIWAATVNGGISW
ncbi:MAG: hypothetical protein WCF39_03055 [Pseudolabrys sp.]